MIAVTKTYLVNTDDIDEAYELTKPNSDKVETFAVGQLRPYDPANPTAQTTTTRPATQMFGPTPAAKPAAT